MERPLLAACLIVKDEERNLPGCLESLRRLGAVISEICVYDTGSTDHTIEIAESYGARVERGFWDNDFGRARNAAAAMTRAKWVLVLDADERVVGNPIALTENLRLALRYKMVGYKGLLAEVASQDTSGGISSVGVNVRIYRPSLASYVGRVHETVRPHAGEMTVFKLDSNIMHLRHLGYSDAAKMRRKGDRNLALAKQAVEDLVQAGMEGERLQEALLHRARSYFLIRSIDECLEDLAKVRDIPVDSRSRRWAGEFLFSLLMDVGQTKRAVRVADEILREVSDADMHGWIRAQVMLANERYVEALEILRTIDAPRSATDLVSSPVNLLEARMIAAAHVGEVDEALACGVRMMAQYGRIKGYGNLILIMWGSRPVNVLAQLLRESDRGYRERIAEEFDACGVPGQQLAESLRAEA